MLRTFTDAWAIVDGVDGTDGTDGVEGWLTKAQGRLLFDAAASAAPGSTIVEIGSFRGRSTILLASGAPDDAKVIAIDPHAGNDRGPQEISGYVDEAESDFATFHQNLANAGVDDRVTHIRAFSDAALAQVSGPVDVLYVDGAHRFGPARDDIARWGQLVPDGGTLLIHDAFSSIGVTGAIAAELFVGTRFRYVERAGSLAVYRADLAADQRWTNMARQAAQLPWFGRNLAVKVALSAGGGRLWERAGRTPPPWPY